MPSLKTLRHQEALFSRLFEELTQIRIDEPERVVQIAQKRKRRKKLTFDGKLNIISADQQARRSLDAGGDPLGMGDREDFITRLVRMMTADAVDGVMATMDVLEELLLMHELMQTKGLTPFLDNKLMIVSLNRGGLTGAKWELDDAITGALPDQCAAAKMDGVKLRWRVLDSDSGSLNTMRYCSDAITSCNRLKLPVFLEPLPVVPEEKGFRIDSSPEALVPLVSAATALGDSSRYLWLILPYSNELARVSMSTTVPILMLSGDAGDSQHLLAEVRDGMNASHNIRGTMIGKNGLFPSDEDPVELARSVHDIVHGTGTQHAGS